MIAYVTIGSNDLARSASFYDALFGVMGLKRIMEMDRLIGWGKSFNEPMFTVCKPFDGGKASGGNGTMIALAAKDKAQVEALHQKALELGASNEGEVGLRGTSFYCGYVRDFDGNKLNFFCMAG